MRDNAVEADNAEEQGEGGESADDPCGRAMQRGVGRVVEALGHSNGVEDGEAGIDRVNARGGGGEQGIFLLRGAEDDAEIVGRTANPSARLDAVRAMHGVREATIFGRAIHALVDTDRLESLRAHLQGASVEMIEPSLEDIFVTLTNQIMEASR
jgi:hypothetical protein